MNLTYHFLEDAFQLARYSVSNQAGFKQMGIKDFALRTAYNLFHWEATSSQQQHQRNTSNSPVTWMDAMVCHVIKSTGQRDNNGNV
jgi:hypothetical protein